MNEYNITVKKTGSIVDQVKVFATSALTAIEAIEKQYKTRSVALIGKNNKVNHYHWTGLEFEARRV